VSVVIAGAGQLSCRADPPAPVVLAAQAARAAAQDSGADVLARVGAIAVVDPFTWQVTDPGALLRAELGLGEDVATLKSAIGGTGPLVLLGALAARIAAGEFECALVAGAEVFSGFSRAMRGEQLGWPVNPEGTPAPETLGEAGGASHPLETAAGMIAPLMYYPLFEHALRGAHGRSVDQQAAHSAVLWARFADVARDNPHAWTQDPPADPGAVGEGNRMAAHPYPKFETANIQVDQAAALILMSDAAADAAGVPRERRVRIDATATAHDHWFAANRDALHRSPALRACAEAIALDLGDVAHVDLYSCFPSAVQIAGAELGIDPLSDARPPTVTGGLTFAGGPANNYVTHALATMTGRLREDPSARGVCTGVGWYMTKHGVALLAGPDAPARAPVLDAHPQTAVDAQPRRDAADEAVSATVEGYTALYDRDGNATIGIVSGPTAAARSARPRRGPRSSPATRSARPRNSTAPGTSRCSPSTVHTRMSRRSDQRRAAVFALYQHDVTGRELDDVFERDASTFTRALAYAADDYSDELDGLIERHAHGWSVDRIAPLEKAIMRVALVEMLHPDVAPADTPIPPEGAIDEAVETAKTYCGADTPKFVNGILAAVLRENAAT